MMRKVFALLGPTMLIAVAVIAQEAPKGQGTNTEVAAPAQPPPKIQFDKTVYDFGNTSMVQQLTGTFTFQNTGQGVLNLKKPTTSCGCTVASVKPDTLKPGEKGELVFTMNVGNIPKGHAEKKITVPSNDPQTPSVSLTVKADIVPVFEYNPQHIPLGDIRTGTSTNTAVEVKRVDGKKMNLTKTESSNPSFHARIVPVESSDGTAAQVVVESVGEGTPRRFNETIKVFADNPSQPAFTIGVSGRLVGPITLSPEAVLWGIADPENWPGPRPELTATRKVRVQSTDPSKPMEIKNPTSSLKDLDLAVDIVETGKVYDVVVKLAAPPKENERGTISFETTLADQRTVTVPVMINVLKRN